MNTNNPSKEFCMKMLRIVLVPVIVLAMVVPSFGQSLEESLGSFLEDNATMYMQPLVTGFGTSMNSGLIKKAKSETGLIPPFGLDLGLVVSLAQVSDEDMNFEFDLSENTLAIDLATLTNNAVNETVILTFDEIYTPDKETTPTIAGDEEGVMLNPKNSSDLYDALYSKLSAEQKTAFDLLPRSTVESNLSGVVQAFQFPDGLDLGVMGVPMFQANIRVPFGIELTARGVPSVDIEDVGKFEMFGGGLRKSLPVPIVNAAVGGMYQTMKFGEFFEATNINIHAEVGKSLGAFGFAISPYVGAGYDMTSVSLGYTYDPLPGQTGDEVDMNFDFEGENGMRLTAGLSLQIPLIYVHAEVSQGTYKSASVSAGLIFK